VITPIVDESVWLPQLKDLPEFEIPPTRILFISPHPDDEVLGAGALLAAAQAQGVEIVLAAVTDGENAYPDNDGLAELRRREQTAATQALNIAPANIHRFGLPDSAVTASIDTLVDLLRPLVTPGTHILAPWTGDFHPDHEACGQAARQVAEQTGATLTWYFFWAWHRGTPETLRGLDLRIFPANDVLIATKLRALDCHHSQLYRATGDPILPANLLGPAHRSFEVFAIA
jgi:LmbE family N-acetylglucosaminyl deacetylase